jgi:hypothetical protein
MKIKKELYEICIPFVLMLVLFIEAESQSAPPLKFKIKDQFDNLHTEKEFLGSVTVIIGSDRGGSRYNGMWTKAIVDSLGNALDSSKITFLPVADVSSIPFFLKGFVKGKFPQGRKEWILMDWEGYFSETYQFAENSCNIVVIDKNGNFIYITSGQQLDNQKLKILCNKIADLVQLSR